MPDLRLIIGAHMRGMVSRIGCFDAVAETINARWGSHVVKGTISRKSTGSLTWDFMDIVGLEDALGTYPVTDTLYRRKVTAAATGNTISPIAHAAIISKETGEAVASILAAEQSDCAGDRAQAVKEIDEAIAALQAARTRLHGAVL